MSKNFDSDLERRFPRRDSRAVTRRAVFRRGLVKEHRFPADHLKVFVAGFATQVLMGPFQGKAGALMVEKRWLPLEAVVAGGAGGVLAGAGELAAVDVLMALLALRRSSLEIGLRQFRSQVGRPVAVNAGGSAMSA